MVRDFNASWGRRRNPSDWSYNLAGQPPLVAGQGYTGHEELPWFNLINMNGRLYDPLVARFLSPDNYVQAPDFTQNFNRYMYCLNNPLKYTDPSGGFAWFIPIIIGAVIGGTSGAIMAHQKHAHGFWEWAGYVGGGMLIGGAAGGAAVGVSALGGSAMLAGAAAGAVGGAGLSGMGTGWNGQAMLRGAAIGAAAGFVGGGFASAIGGGWGALAGGAASNITGQILSTGDVNWTQVGVSAALSFGMYHAMSYAGYKWGGGDNLGGKHISYRQYCGMNADYQRSRFWHKENGGYLMTDGSIKRVPYTDEHYLGVEFKNPPSGAWASYHTHWANPGTTYQVTLPNYDKPTDLDLLLGNYTNGVASQYHDAQDLSITGNTYVINRFDGSFHPYGAASYSVITPDPFIRFFMFNWWW